MGHEGAGGAAVHGLGAQAGDRLHPAGARRSEITIRSFVREFRGPDALIECTMADAGGKDLSRCLMIVACVDKDTNRAKDWPADAMALFYEKS